MRIDGTYGVGTQYSAYENSSSLTNNQAVEPPRNQPKEPEQYTPSKEGLTLAQENVRVKGKAPEALEPVPIANSRNYTSSETGGYIVEGVAQILNTNQFQVKSLLKDKQIAVEDLIDENKSSTLSNDISQQQRLSSYSANQKQALMEQLNMEEEQFLQLIQDMKSANLQS